ncbi:MAG: hypothetical protein COW92_00515 [Candidatus Omnitrophica bacterium CG22_combo_CG10-13_8_21_14_all_43_16]|nr:MAG: hypothetical protein COW92_00515 [Candidatus Omnitrophica bacterium CG22_combo_CG10-13_8_21_14_all_43_16]
MTKAHALYKRIAIVTAILIAAIFFMRVDNCAASDISIKSAMKVHVMGGYVILINYETYDKWIDGVLFKVHCKFEKKDFTFTSSSISNIERGWHKTQIAIADVIKKRYGSLRSYEVELYKNGVLVDSKKYL